MTPHKTDALDTELRARLFDVLNCYEIDASEISHGTTYIDSREAKRLVDRIMPYIQTHYLSREAVREAIERSELDFRGRTEAYQNEGELEVINRIYKKYAKAFDNIRKALGLEGGSSE